MTNEVQLELLKPDVIVIEVCHAKYLNYICISQGSNVFVEAGRRRALAGQAKISSVKLKTDESIQRLHGLAVSDCVSNLYIELSSGRKLGPYGNYSTVADGNYTFDFEVHDVRYIRAKTHSSQNFVEKIYIG